MQEIQLQSWRDPRNISRPYISYSIRCVRLDALKERLGTSTEKQVLSLLSRKDNPLLATVSTAAVKCVFVSYRQEVGTQDVADAPYDEFTLDGNALRGIIAAATRLGAEAMWLDCWCYRYVGEYDHQAFCRTLHDVICGVHGVVWLPRSKSGSLGEYGYRLWCTFEAACAQQRGLRVAIAGYGLSHFQQRVAQLGSFTPALWGDGTIDALCRLNLFFYITIIAYALTVLFNLINEEYGFALVNVVLGFFGFPGVWLVFRGMLGQQRCLARNARRVLRIMSGRTQYVPIENIEPSGAHDGGEQGGRGGGDTSYTSAGGGWHGGGSLLSGPVVGCHVEREQAQQLLQDLAWLPAYDRRDSLVVQEVLGRLRPDLKLKADNICALAFSSYVAARMQPSEGDATAVALPLCAWLRQRDICIDDAAAWTLSLRSRRESDDSVSASARRSAATSSCSSGKAPSHTHRGEGLTWLHGDQVSTADQTECLPMVALTQLGWVAVTSATSALVSPLGALAMNGPDPYGRWSLRGGHMGLARPLRPMRDLGVFGGIFFAQIGIMRLFFITSLFISGNDITAAVVSGRPAQEAEGGSATRGADLASGRAATIAEWVTTILGVASNTLLFPLLIWLIFLVGYAGVSDFRRGQCPLPVLVFNGHLGNILCLLVVAMVTAPGIWGLTIMIPGFRMAMNELAEDPLTTNNATHPMTREVVWSNAASTISNALLNFAQVGVCTYEFVLYATLVVASLSVAGERGKWVLG